MLADWTIRTETLRVNDSSENHTHTISTVIYSTLFAHTEGTVPWSFKILIVTLDLYYPNFSAFQDHMSYDDISY